MKLFIKPHNETAWEFYRNHGHFHDGDAGLDLYVLENILFEPGETKAIKLGISCEPEDGKAYYLFPRSSISKTPLRMSNSIGLIDGGIEEKLWLCVIILNLKHILPKKDSACFNWWRLIVLQFILNWLKN